MESESGPAAERIEPDQESFEESAAVEESGVKTSPEPAAGSGRDLNGNLVAAEPDVELAIRPDAESSSHVKPSYQVISVREPMAKMLAGRSQPSSLYEEIGEARCAEAAPAEQQQEAAEERPFARLAKDGQPTDAAPIYSVINKSARRAPNSAAAGNRCEPSWPAANDEHTYSSLAGSQSSYVLYEEIRAQGSESSSSLYDQIQPSAGYETIAAKPTADQPDSDRPFARLPAMAPTGTRQQQVGQDVQEQPAE